MELDALYVHPAYQRRGLGRQLVAEVTRMARAAGCRSLMLAVNKRNDRAIAAYHRYGFRVRAAVVKDIGDGFVMDDFIMSRNIDQGSAGMAFDNPSIEEIRDRLKHRVKTIAVVGLSPKADRPSYHVAAEMQRYGFRIIPVRPALAEVLGEKAYPSLAEVPEAIDLVDVFRAPEHVDAIVDECIRLKLPAIWLQDKVINEAAAQRARDAGMWVVMDRCVYRDYRGHCA